MITKVMRSGINIFKDAYALLYIQVFLFICLPIIYMIYLGINMQVLQVGISEILINSPTECLNMILKFTSLYAAHIVLTYMKDRQSRFLILSYFVVFVAQLLQANIITSVIMGLYIYSYIGLKNVKELIVNNAWGKGKLTFLLSLAIMLISLLVLFLKMMI